MSLTIIFYICMAILAILVIKSCKSQSISMQPILLGYVMQVFFFFKHWVSWIPLVVYGILGLIICVIWVAILNERDEIRASNQAVKKQIKGFFNGAKKAGPSTGLLGAVFNTAVNEIQDTVSKTAENCKLKEESDMVGVGRFGNIAYILALGIHLFINRV